MLITGVGYSNDFKNKEEVLEIVKQIEQEYSVSLQDYLKEVTFYKRPKSLAPFQATFVRENKIIEINSQYAENERESLAHELIHAVQEKQGRLPQIIINDSFFPFDYYCQQHEKEAWIVSTKLYGTAQAKRRISELYSLIGNEVR